MNLHLKLRRNRKGIGTVFAMVFFLLIVMVVFASFMIILSQNTGLEQTTIQAKQLDLDRYTELETVSIANPETAVLNNVVYISCSLTDNGTLPTQFVRLWIKDITQNTTGNIIMTPAITLQPGSSTYYFKSTYVANAGSYDQFSFWFITARGNTISSYPAINQFNAITSNGTFPGVANMNSTYATNNTPLQLSLNTTMPNQLIYVVVSYDDGNTLYTPTSSPSLTWTLRGASPSTDYYSSGDSILKTFYAIDPSSGPITISIQSTADELSDYYCSALAFAISGVNTTSPFDGSTPQISIGQSTMPKDTITTYYSNDLVIGALGIDDLNPAITPGAGFAQIMPVQSSYGASGEPNSMPRSVWSEWSIIQAPRTNLPVNCTFTDSNAWAIIVDAVRLVIIPPVAPVSLFPTSGPIGQPVTVSGQGFAANSQLIAAFDGSQIPFSFTTDGSGNIPPGATFTVPLGSTAGNKTVTIIDSSFNYANATFQVTTPNITVNPTSGPVGTNVTVTGSNFIDNSNITINFDGNPIATNPSIVTANATGWFSATFNFNVNDTAGVKQVLASDGVNSAYANFNVTSSIALSPINGPIGSSVNMTGSGFAASQPVIVTFAGSTIQTIPVSFNTNGVGFFNASFTVPTGQTAGGKTVNATDASSNSAIATFTLTPSISLNPTSGNAGSTVTVSGSGFAGNSGLTATFAGSTVTISGTTSTNSSGSFTGANFTVPVSTAGGAQTVVIKDASSNSANATYTVNTLYQKITVAINNSAPSATVTVNGGYPSPNAFAADGTPYNIMMVAGASFNLSFSNSGNTRDGFIVSNAFSATSSSYTASTNSISVPAYEQVQNTFSATFNGGSPGSGDSLTLTGTYLGAGSSTIVTLNSGNSWRASAWSDYNTAATFPVSTANSGSSEHWTIGSAYSTTGLTAGGNTYSQTYYHQYLQTLSYTVVGVGSPTAPTATGTALGVAYVPSLTTSATPYWFDALGSITFSTSAIGPGEQWGPIPASISATSAHTQIVSMYHQYQVTFSQSGLDSSTASGTVLTVNGTNVAYSSLPYTVWVNSGDRLVYAYNATVASTTVGKQFVVGTVSPVSPLVGISSAQTVTASYTTQYQLTMVTNLGTTTPAVGNTWYNAGSTVTISATAPTPGAGERYVWNGWTGIGSGSYTGTNNPATNLVTMNAAITETASWTHQYQVSFAVSPSGSGTTSPSGTNVWENAGSLTISATYNSGYRFSVWSATGSITITSASSASTTATISGTGTITATFTQNAPQTVTLSPNGAGSYTQLSQFPSYPGSNYDKVDETTSDGDSTYVYTYSTSTQQDSYTFTDTSATGTINSVTIYIVARATSSGTASTIVRISGTPYYGSSNTLTTSYASYSTSYTLNPATSIAWTWSDVNSLDAGVRLATTGGYGSTARCTQVYVVVNYTPP